MTEEQEQTPTEQIAALAEFIVTTMLPEGAQVDVSAKERRGEVTVSINPESQYRGAVIGKGGAVVRAIRQLLTAGRFGDTITRIDVDIAD